MVTGSVDGDERLSKYLQAGAQVCLSCGAAGSDRTCIHTACARALFTSRSTVVVGVVEVGGWVDGTTAVPEVRQWAASFPSLTFLFVVESISKYPASCVTLSHRPYRRETDEGGNVNIASAGGVRGGEGP